MARPERRDIDYFPFYVKDGRTLFILENKYQCKGTGFFTNLFRLLSRTPDHHLQIATESDQMYFFASVKCDPESGLDMIEMMVATGKLDKDLWEKHSVLASPDFLESIQEAYRRRSGKCVTIEEIYDIYKITTGNNSITTGNKPQSKVKEIKLNNSKSARAREGPDKKPDKKLYLEDVRLMDTEYDKLINKYGLQITERAIEILNGYKMANGRKYKSDYHAMLNWVIDKARGLDNKPPGKGPAATAQNPGGRAANEKPLTKEQMEQYQLEGRERTREILRKFGRAGD